MVKLKERRYGTIKIVRKGLIHLRRSVKMIMLMLIAAVIIVGIMSIFYKATYAVTLNGVEIGYTSDKTKLQERINTYIQSGDGSNVAFISVDKMPEYHICFVKRDTVTNDDERYNEVISQGDAYYKYYAILEDGEEKYNVPTYSDGETVINTLKDKESTNAEKITVVEKFAENEAEYTSVDDAVNGLYKKKVVKYKYSGGSAPSATANTSGTYVNLGITLIRPTAGVVTSRFAWRWGRQHKGIDIGASYGTPIYAAASGTVAIAQYGYGGGYGNYVLLDHGNGVQTLYGHCSSLAVSSGQYVNQGQVIGYVGSTGNSTGNHLHFEVRVNGVAQNPQNYVY